MLKLPVADYIRQMRQTVKNDNYDLDECIRKILSENGIKEYPINVFDIAKKMGFDIRRALFKDDSISGILWDGMEEATFAGGKYKRVIFVNANETPQRQLFTVAHEIGHFILHCNDESNFYERYITNKDVVSEQKKMEDDADFFAANLLLPKGILNQYIKVNGLVAKDEIIKRVTEDFFVEPETISKRLEEIGYGV